MDRRMHASFRNAQKSVVGILASMFVIDGCTSVDVQKVEATKYPMTLVCIKQNPQVLVDDFLSVVEDGFQRHGIETEVYENATPKTCEYVLDYTATRGWDLVPFLKSCA
jgi:hypothetical protein